MFRSIASSPLPLAMLVDCTPFNNMYIFLCSLSLGLHESGKQVLITMHCDRRWHCQSCQYSDNCKHKLHAIEFAIEARMISELDQSLPCDKHLGSEASNIENILLMKAGG